jgi:putative NADPH-quinone reductase
MEQSMNALVVYCHPVEGSFCSAMRDAAIRGLQHAGHKVSVIDLALENFNPVMPSTEWKTYVTMDEIVSAEMQRHVRELRRAEIVVFVYPTWWSGLPAQLKGWLERVMLPGVAFRLSSNHKVRPALTHMRRIVVVSTYGSPWLYVKAVNDNGRRILTRALRLSTSFRTRTKSLGLYAMDKATADDRAAFLARIEKKMARI